MRYLFRKRILRAAAAVLDATGLLWKLAGPRRAKNKGSRRFLVVRLDHLGDVLFASAVPQLLKENEAGCRVSFLTSSAGAALLQNNPFVDEVLVYDAPWFARKKGRTGGTLWALLRKIKNGKFDAALCPRGDVRENWLGWAAGIPERMGYGVTGGGFFLSHPLVYRSGAHERERTLDVLKAAGVHATLLRPALYFSKDEEMTFEAAMKARGLTDRRFIGVQLEAGTEAKRWPEANVNAFLHESAKRLDRAALVFLGDDDKSRRHVADLLDRHPHLPWKNLIGETALRELFWLIKHCGAFIGHDSGPSHVAASFGVPTLFLYSGTNRWEEWRSLEESAEFLRNPVPCSPCHRTECPVPGHPCMAGIEPEKAVRWAEERAPR